MQVILQGSLRHFPPADLLSFIVGRGLGVTLDLETTGKKTRIFLQNDKIVWAESSHGGDAAAVVLDACEWTAGTFTLLDSVALPENAKPVSLDVGPLLDDAKRRAAGIAFPDAIMFHVVDNPALQQQVSLTADEFKLLFRVAAGRSFKDLVADLGMPRRELSERLQSLIKLGLVKPEKEEPPPAEPTAPHQKISRKRTLVGSLTPDAAPDNIYPLLDAVHSIGRSPENSIAISDGSVSATHAQILRTPEGFVVEDLQSRNGTFVNGEKVTEKRLLADGDLIRIGKVMMTFNVAREAKAGETTQPEVRVG